MQFLNPLFLLALTALAVPIIIHLFNFRKYKKVFFTNVHFLAEIKQESKKRSELKHLLILLMRLLAIACLVIAFAQPYIASPFQQKRLSGRQAISVYIDNSFSMEALATNGKLLDVAKGKALEIAAAYKPSDLFQLLTADFEGKHQRFVNRDEFKTMVEEVSISPSFRSLSTVIQRQVDLVKGIPGVNRSIYLISDFQQSSTDISRVRPDTSLSYFLIPISSEKRNNLYIDSAWFDTPFQQPGQGVQLKVKIRNGGDEPLEKIPVKLTINKVQKAVASFSVEADGQTLLTLPFTNNLNGIQNGMIELTDYPVSWDDKFYVSYPILPETPVLCINGDKPNVFINALFENDSSIRLTNVASKQLDYSSFQRYPLVILNSVDDISSGMGEELKRFLDRGGNLLIFPPTDLQSGSTNTFLGSIGLPSYASVDTARLRVSELNVLNKIYTDVFEKDASGRIVLPNNMDMPQAFRHYTLSGSTKAGLESLLRLQNGDLLVGSSLAGKGMVYLSTVPLEEKWTNLMKHPVFVPTLYRIVLLSRVSPALFYRIGSDEPIEIKQDSIPTAEVYVLREEGSDFEAIPETKSVGGVLALYPHDQVKKSGNYNVYANKQIVSGVAFNYSSLESDLVTKSPDELQKELKQAGFKYFSLFQGKKAPLTKAITEISQGTPLWKLFILLTLLFIGLEIVLIRLLKE